MSKAVLEVAAALIWNNNKFLICQRPENKACPLLWEFVGGKVEHGESKETALIRECREELGIKISVNSLFIICEHSYDDYDVNLSVFEAEILEGKPQKLEHNNIKWISISETPNYKFCPADDIILEKIKEKYSKIK